MKPPQTIAFVFILTTACGGLPFTAGEITVLDGETLVSDGGTPELDGEIEAWSDKESTDGGSEVDSAGLDGGLVGLEAGDAADAALAAHDASEPDACDPGAALWECTGYTTNVIVNVGQFCLFVLRNGANSPNPKSVAATADPASCGCANTCACVMATNPCGAYAVVGCSDQTNSSNGGPEVECDAQGNP